MKGTFFSSLRARLILLVLLAVIPALGVICYVAQEQRRVVSVEAQQNALRLARLVSANQENSVEGARQLLTALAQVPVVRAGHPAPCSAFLGDLLKAYPLYANFGVTDPKGEIFCSGLPLKDRVNAADRAWFQRAVQTRDFAIGDYQIGRITGKATVNFGYPILDDKGQTRAVAFAALDLAWLNKLAAETNLPPGTTVTVIDPNGTIFVRYPDPKKWIGRAIPDGSLLKAIRAQKNEGTTEATGLDGVQRLYGFASLGGGAVIVGVPRDVAFGPAKRILAHSIGWLALICVLAVAGAWFGGNWLILRQVNALIQATKQLGAGDLNVRAGLSDDKGELHQLARAFDQMAEALQNRQTEAKWTQEENTKLFQETQRNLERIRALQEIEQAITSTLDFRTVLNVLLEKIDFLLPYAAATVRLFNKESGVLEPVACRNLDEEQWRAQPWTGGRGLANVVFENKAPTVIRNTLTDVLVRDPNFYRKHRLISFLGIPLIVKNEVLGVISFYTKEEHEFSKEEVEFLSTLAGQVAIAIHNSQLYEQSKSQAVELEKANRDLERREEIQKLLKELSQDITTLDLDSLLKKFTEKVREILKVDVVDVRVFVEETGWKLMGIAGIDPNLLTSTRSGTGRGRAGWIQKHRQPLMIPDLTRSDRPSGATLKNLCVRGYLGVPLLSRGGEAIGVLRALTYEPREFTQEEVDLLEQLASGAGIALENSRLVEHIKKQTIELEKADKVKDEFLGFVSHELKTPVTEMIRDKMLGEINLEQERALSKVIRSSNNLIAMVNSLLAATKIQAGAVKVDRKSIGLGDFFEELRVTYDVSLGKELALIWDYPSNLPEVETDGDKLGHILHNLIDNAIKYTDKGSVIVSARHLPNISSVEFKVADTGIGIPEEALPFIFEMFQQANGSETRSGGGVGLGLHIVKKFTELLGGKIDVQSELNKGSIFTVTIPYENPLRAIKDQAVSA
jgi:signal transduction histidine kinase